jgi:membrane-associated protease RseP (regulator of RpoE activity)
VSATPILDLSEGPPKPPQTRWNGFLFLPALYVTVTIHELGHLLAGRIEGMRPGAIVIGGIVMFKSGKRWLIRFNFRRMFSGGLAKLLPQKDDFRPASFGWMIAGGPFASLAFTIVCGLVEFRYGSGPGDGHPPSFGWRC